MIVLNQVKPVIPVTQEMIEAGCRQYPMPPDMMRSILENALRHATLPKDSGIAV